MRHMRLCQNNVKDVENYSDIKKMKKSNKLIKELLKNDEVKAHFYRIDNGCIISLNTEKINSVITLKY